MDNRVSKDVQVVANIRSYEAEFSHLSQLFCPDQRVPSHLSLAGNENIDEKSS